MTEQAKQAIVQGLEKATKAGVFSLAETSIILSALKEMGIEAPELSEAKEDEAQDTEAKEVKYIYLDNNNEIVGTTDNVCQTMINLFNAFRDNRNRKVFFEIDKSRKVYINREQTLQYQEINDNKVYKYQGKVITRKDFIILLGCEEE